jgi:hypothetical protein
MKDLIKQGMPIAIISGEGEVGSVEHFTGTHTQRAIKARLTRERCNGDRWARAVQYSHCDGGSGVGVDLETGYYVTWPGIE